MTACLVALKNEPFPCLKTNQNGLIIKHLRSKSGHGGYTERYVRCVLQPRHPHILNIQLWPELVSSVQDTKEQHFKWPDQKLIMRRKMHAK